MTKQEADFIGSMNMCDEISNEAYKKIMCNCEVEEKQPCEDCISRDEAIRISEQGQIQGFEWQFKKLCTLSSVTPQHKTGYWIIVDDCERFIAKCSECGRIEDSRMINKYPYCHCGAKMGGGEE